MNSLEGIRSLSTKKAKLYSSAFGIWLFVFGIWAFGIWNLLFGICYLKFKRSINDHPLLLSVHLAKAGS